MQALVQLLATAINFVEELMRHWTTFYTFNYSIKGKTRIGSTPKACHALSK